MPTGTVEFICHGCGDRVITFRYVNYRTIPPTCDERDLCPACKEIADEEPVHEPLP